jgi:uncharacterized protein YndB with AHSA1/START domain
MTKLFVDKSIEIRALAARVWDVLTRPEFTLQWAGEFAGGGSAIHIVSDWVVGSPVIWKDARGHNIVEGTVTAFERHHLLRFTVFDVKGEPAKTGPDDGITYKLTERDGRTTLWLSQGDFSGMKEGEKYRDLSEAVWDRVLPKVKKIAEGVSHYG